MTNTSGGWLPKQQNGSGLEPRLLLGLQVRGGVARSEPPEE